MSGEEFQSQMRLDSFLATDPKWVVYSEANGEDAVFRLAAGSIRGGELNRLVATSQVLQEFVLIDGEQRALKFLQAFGPFEEGRLTCRLSDLLKAVDSCKAALRKRKLLSGPGPQQAELRVAPGRSGAILKATMTSKDVRSAIVAAVFVGKATGRELRLCEICQRPFTGRTKLSVTCGARCRSRRSSQALRTRRKQKRTGEPYVFE